jgi:hypothetical protein
MRWNVFGLRLRSLLRPARVEHELDEEVRHHLELQVEENVAAGMSAEEARYSALRDFGGVEQRKEECRDARGLAFVDSVRQDLRYALRTLGKNRAFTVVAVVSIGLGVGANSAIFSLVDQALLQQLPVREPERLVLLSWKGTFIGKGWGSGDLLSHPMFRDLKADNPGTTSTSSACAPQSVDSSKSRMTSNRAPTLSWCCRSTTGRTDWEGGPTSSATRFSSTTTR